MKAGESDCGVWAQILPRTGQRNRKSFTGRWNIAQKNIEIACKQASSMGQTVACLPVGGTAGNTNPATIYPGILHGAQMSWNGQNLKKIYLDWQWTGLWFTQSRARQKNS